MILTSFKVILVPYRTSDEENDVLLLMEQKPQVKTTGDLPVLDGALFLSI